MSILNWFKPDPIKKLDKQVLDLVRRIMNHPAQTSTEPKYGVYQIKKEGRFTLEYEYSLYILGTMAEGLKIYDNQKCLVRGKWQNTIVDDLQQVLLTLDRVAELRKEKELSTLQQKIKEAEAAYDLFKP